jgi:hypothetical protein
MAEVPFELRYQLSRRQRLGPHLRIWGVVSTPFVVALFAFFCVQTVVSVCSLSWPGLAVFGGLALGVFVLHRGLFLGLLDVLLVPARSMDLRVEENGLGVLAGGERWWLFLDGLTGIDQLTAGVWTLRHWNGSVVHIPADAITEAQLGHLRAAMERGRTPEGVRAVIERGRRLAELERGEQQRHA